MSSKFRNRVMLLLPEPEPEVLEFGTDHNVLPQFHDLQIEISPENILHLRISKHFFVLKNPSGGNTLFVNLKEKLTEEQQRILLSIGQLKKQK